MQVKILRVEAGYRAHVTPSHGDDVSWTTDEPMSRQALVDKLAGLGFHQQDIGDAFYEGDPEWLVRPHAE